MARDAPRRREMDLHAVAVRLGRVLTDRSRVQRLVVTRSEGTSAFRAMGRSCRRPGVVRLVLCSSRANLRAHPPVACTRMREAMLASCAHSFDSATVRCRLLRVQPPVAFEGGLRTCTGRRRTAAEQFAPVAKASRSRRTSGLLANLATVAETANPAGRLPAGGIFTSGKPRRFRDEFRPLCAD